MGLFLRLLRLDLTLQARSFLYPATVVSTATICGVILLLPERPLTPRLTAFLVFMDPATIGLSFVGAIVLMEKSDGTLSALAATPIKPVPYVGAKAVSLTLLTLASTLVVVFTATGGRFDAWRLFVSVPLCSSVAVLIGLACVVRMASMNQLVVTLLWVMTLLYLPLLGFFGVGPDSLAIMLAPIPSSAMLVSLLASADPAEVSVLAQASAVAYLSVCVAIGWAWVVREFERSIVTEGR